MRKDLKLLDLEVDFDAFRILGPPGFPARVRNQISQKPAWRLHAKGYRRLGVLGLVRDRRTRAIGRGEPLVANRKVRSPLPVRAFVHGNAQVPAGQHYDQRLRSKAQRKPKRIFKDANDLGTNDAKRPRLELPPPEPKDVIASEGDCAPEVRVVSRPPLLTPRSRRACRGGRS